MVTIEFLGGVRTVTGSATLFEKGGVKWLVDCGMFQGGKELESRNRNVQSYYPNELAFILLTHAHIDHSGLIPKLVKEGFQGKVICTRATKDLCEIMLQDSGHIQEMEAEWSNRKAKRLGRKEILPLYTLEDAKRSLQYFQAVDYGEIVTLGDGIKIRFQDAGHILGSSIIELWLEDEGKEKKIVFSGDLGGLDQPIVKDPSVIEEAHILWLESTYGNRFHKSRQETVEELLRIVKEAIHDQGKVVIPAFAVERTQDIIYTLGGFIREGLIQEIPVYIDSPLAISATEIFKRNSDCFDDETKRLLLQGDNPFEPPWIIYTRSIEESKAINEDPRPGVIISASGMCDSGRIKHHLKHHLWQKTSHIVFVGYQAEGTIGRKIVDGAKSVRLFGEEVAVKAQVHTLGGFSAHADQKGLLEWLSHFKNPELEIFLVHGEEKVQMEFSKVIENQFHLKPYIPKWKEKKVLFTEEITLKSSTLPYEEEPHETYSIKESLSYLIKHFDRNYKKLRRKLKHLKTKGIDKYDPLLTKEIEEINKRIESLESKLMG